MTAPDDALTQEPAHGLTQELTRERNFHEACRAAMTGMAEGATQQVVSGENAFASGADAEVLGYQLRSWAKALNEEPDSPLFFGRLDHLDGQSYHIGRRRITEQPRHGTAPPLVVDWRAPVSRAFYQASARDPQGVAVRRRFGWAPWSKGDSADLSSLEDERLTAGDSAGSAILAGEIERPRVGPMRDIAATIQPEQDDLVRSGLAESVCVQGAPGTGKTAVGLHRAAYLLYTYPQRIQRRGLLILGPNRTFLSYISEVLPSLGETGIRQSTVDDEIARHEVRAQDSEAAAAVKHDARMAAVLHRALYVRVSAPAEEVAVPDGSYRWRVPLDELEQIVAEVRAEAPPYAVGRERVRIRAVRWDRPPRSYKSAKWSAADLVLLDELAGLMERPEGYGHIVVDEAQDLSPMQCRAVARRAGFGSLTVLGDLAQGTTPWAARTWSEQLAHLGKEQAAVVPLTTGFRVPAAIVDLANRLVPALGVDVPPARSMRGDGELTIREVDDLAAATVDAVRAALDHQGSIGVIADGPETDRLRAALAEAGIATATADDLAAEARVTVLPATVAKGLEYDHVVVAEPAAIAGAETRGLHRLYVVLTRAVSRLDVLHRGPLPPELEIRRGGE
ncbi:AAA family ATPase [Streptomyces lunaelactis]|uniref:HelD family protein n=1 Tax=Streptomyces lunaelactis TaxID=1535768 RepID=UPI0015859108|nr:AAA family ATPase [Streptomyces lunaelactis]NUK35904.1 AAA family ATPase [Streptomyces lunaelactis]NUK42917.1 AAA family ATPase [Streptomyces lunaelactis]